MKKIVLICSMFMVLMCTSCTSTSKFPETTEDFSFRLTWGCYGISSYDSETGTLVKTTDATHPEDYVTTYQLTEAELEKIYDLIRELDVESYPETYNPHDGLLSSPTMTLILVVRDGEEEKKIEAKDIALSFDSSDKKGQKFLDTCETIRDILMETEEWKALPDYEFLYD